MKKRFVVVVCAFLLLGLSSRPAQAHYLIDFQMPGVPIFLNALFPITIWAYLVPPPLDTADGAAAPAGDGEDLLVNRVGLALSWNPDVLSWAFDNVLPPWDQHTKWVDVDHEAGLANIFLESEAGITSDDFRIDTVTFYSHALGSSPITVDNTSGWCADLDCGVFAGDVEFETMYGQTVVSVVPVPATAFLLASALLGLIGIGRKKKHRH